MIEFYAGECTNYEAATGREWLETNGLGGWASSTVAGVNTRRYHGLLVAALRPPVGRYVLLSKLEEAVVVGGRRIELSANQYPGVVHPLGYTKLVKFKLQPFPTWVFEADGVTIHKAVFTVHGENTTVVEYRFEGIDEVTFEVRPLIAFRDYHSLTHENGGLDSHVTLADGCAVVKPYRDLPSLYLAHNAQTVSPQGHWYRNFEYYRERDRGLDCREDLFNPLVAHWNVKREGVAVIVASTEQRDAAQADSLREREVRRKQSVAAPAISKDPFVRQLVEAADQYIVDRGDLKTIVAGYHWFGDWGRDTMIALPGIALVNGRHDVARQILLAFSETLSEGMLPNRFPDSGEAPEYNTVDATLWFFEAVRGYEASSGDLSLVDEHLYPKLKEVIDWHLRGTRFGIRVDADGLLRAGVPGVQLTWMDVKIGDRVVTPRHGKPVEVQALWYNALCVLESLAHRNKDPATAEFVRQLAALAKKSFVPAFWNAQNRCLYDCVDGSERDEAVRPNQIFAVSLHHPILDGEAARDVVECVQRELLTPLGLRTLSRSHSGYRGRYEGGVVERDTAYHQGTVWPWLIGPFVTAYVKVHGGSPEARSRAADWLEPMARHLHEAGLGHISEVASADTPHTPGGCIAQAWSVAEVLRAAVGVGYAKAGDATVSVAL